MVNEVDFLGRVMSGLQTLDVGQQREDNLKFTVVPNLKYAWPTGVTWEISRGMQNSSLTWTILTLKKLLRGCASFYMFGFTDPCLRTTDHKEWWNDEAVSSFFSFNVWERTKCLKYVKIGRQSYIYTKCCPKKTLLIFLDIVLFDLD